MLRRFPRLTPASLAARRAVAAKTTFPLLEAAILYLGQKARPTIPGKTAGKHHAKTRMFRGPVASYVESEGWRDGGNRCENEWK